MAHHKSSIIHVLLFLISIHSINRAYSQTIPTKETYIALLKEMFELDQSLRKKALALSEQSSQPLSKAMEALHVSDINHMHIGKLKELITHYGWPKITEFGDEACKHAWIIVQHSQDSNFQEYCLHLMQALPQEDVDATLIAYLYDRIQTNQNKPQRYGTQINSETQQPFEIDHPEKVNERRKSVGLQPLEEYLQFCAYCTNKYRNTKQGEIANAY